MITLEELIKNEVKHILGHEPSTTELASVSEHLAGKKIYWIVDLELAIVEWEKTHTRECAWCGDRFLESEMQRPGPCEYFCSDQCKKDYKEEHGLIEDRGEECTE